MLPLSLWYSADSEAWAWYDELHTIGEFVFWKFRREMVWENNNFIVWLNCLISQNGQITTYDWKWNWEPLPVHVLKAVNCSTVETFWVWVVWTQNQQVCGLQTSLRKLMGALMYIHVVFKLQSRATSIMSFLSIWPNIVHETHLTRTTANCHTNRLRARVTLIIISFQENSQNNELPLHSYTFTSQQNRRVAILQVW